MKYNNLINIMRRMFPEQNGKEEWATRIAPQGNEYTLDDGATVWINYDEDRSKGYVLVSLNNHSQQFMVKNKSDIDYIEDNLESL